MRQGMDRPAVAGRDRTVDEIHGRPVADPYRWLEDADAADTRRWELAQEEMFGVASARWAGRDAFRRELRRLARFDRVSAPLVRGGRFFYTRRGADAEHAVLMVGDGERHRPLVDPMALDPSGRCTLEAWSPSPDGRLLAYQVSFAGTENSTLHVLDVTTGAPVDGPIDRVRRTSVGWLPDAGHFYYVRRRTVSSQYDRRVFLHRVGADPDTDACVFGDGRGSAQYYAVATSPCGRYLTVRATEGTSVRSDLWLADLSGDPLERPRWRAVHEDLDAQTVATVVPAGGAAATDRLFLRTDLDAPMGRVVTAPLHDPTPGRWTTFIAERPGIVLDDFAVLPDAGVALATWLVDGAHTVTVHDLTSGAQTGTLALPGTGCLSRIHPSAPGSVTGYAEYTDFATPPTVLRVDGAGGVHPWTPPSTAPARPPVRAVTRTVVVESTGGARVTVFVVSPTGRPDRPRPTVLSAYGGFGVPMTPMYSLQALAWVAAGGVYAFACIRGGGERGRQWHLDAVRTRRQNAFDDFDAVARYLLTAGWSGTESLGISGSSNGGLLMCVALTQHPERYAAVAAMAPLADMVRYEHSGMGPSWREEYGSVADPAQFAALLAYSPYHNTVPGTRYPAVLLAAFDGDSRVDPLHARKMCAALQHASTGDRPVLFRLERGVGHGARALSRTIDLLADVSAFLAAELGLGALPGAVPQPRDDATDRLLEGAEVCAHGDDG